MVERVQMSAIVVSVLGWVKDSFAILTQEPTIYFVGVALVGAVFGISKKVIPMRRK